MLAVAASTCAAERLRGLPTDAVPMARGAEERVRMLLMLTGVCEFCTTVFSRLSEEKEKRKGKKRKRKKKKQNAVQRFCLDGKIHLAAVNTTK